MKERAKFASSKAILDNGQAINLSLLAPRLRAALSSEYVVKFDDEDRVRAVQVKQKGLCIKIFSTGAILVFANPHYTTKQISRFVNMMWEKEIEPCITEKEAENAEKTESQ